MKVIDQLINDLFLALYRGDNAEVNRLNYLLETEFGDTQIYTKSKLYSIVSEIIGVNERTVFNKVNGYTPFTIDDIVKLSKHFNIQPADCVEYLLKLRKEAKNEK